MDKFELDETSQLPVWLQLRNRFVYLIKTGHYKPGDQLPSVRSLAAEQAINYNTVSKVYVNLEHDGYVVSVRGKGVYVRKIDDEKQDDISKISEAIIEDSIKRCLSMGMSFDEVKLKLIDVSQRMQQESRTLGEEKRGYYEGKNS